ASDRYALAVLAFELLTGSRPYAGDSTPAEAAAHVHAPIPSVCDRRAELPCELDPVFERALAKDPAERFATAAEFVAGLRGAFDAAAGKTSAIAAVPPPPPPPRAGESARRPPPPGRHGFRRPLL